METIHASYPLHPPGQHAAHLAESRPRPTYDQTTRTMQSPDLQSQQLSAPASQESITSIGSYTSSTASQIESAGSIASQLTSYTDSTSPSSSAPIQKARLPTFNAGEDASIRDSTPEIQTDRDGDVKVLASPADISTPVANNGRKRSADGRAKDILGGSLTPSNGIFKGNRSRATSAASSSSSRAGELAANLKARLGYAMTKVQNGWEHKPFSEVERLAAQKAANRHSMSHLDYNRRPLSSGLSNGTARLSMYEPQTSAAMEGAASPPSKRLPGSYTTFAPTRAPHLSGAIPRLQPAPDIRPSNGYRSHPYAPPVQRVRHNSAMSPPRTPISQQPRRPHPIRTDTQTAEAEREALQALFQLGSPHASQISHARTTSRASSSQASPLRAEFATPRRVTFARSHSAESMSDASDPTDSAVHDSRQQALENLEGK
jgi:hypothetical protein